MRFLCFICPLWPSVARGQVIVLLWQLQTGVVIAMEPEERNRGGQDAATRKEGEDGEMIGEERQEKETGLLASV